MPLELTHPWCLIGLIALPIVIWYYVWSLSDFPKRQRQISLLVRSVILVLTVLACAGLTWQQTSSEKFVMFVVDRSLSIGETGQTATKEYLQKAKLAAGSQKTGLLTFAGEPGEILADIG